MHKKLTISIDEEIYEALYLNVGKRQISKFIERLIKPHLLNTSLEDGYKAMANDEEREQNAQIWCNSLIKDNNEER
ncbi:MAG: hypothetical protein RLZZ210_1595 [Pseudomonadota bacterium]|jgi:predicted CopG family antitoxin